jgi:uncharacterized membrane protein YkvA (DUF1232 family)
VNSLLRRWKRWAKALIRSITALGLAYKNPEVPWYAKLLGIIVVAYALSPIDLIPDFIPILGYLDDLILLPLGIAATIKLIPSHIWEDCLARADSEGNHGKNWIAGGIILLIWIGFAAVLVLKLI